MVVLLTVAVMHKTCGSPTQVRPPVVPAAGDPAAVLVAAAAVLELVDVEGELVVEADVPPEADEAGIERAKLPNPASWYWSVA